MSSRRQQVPATATVTDPSWPKVGKKRDVVVPTGLDKYSNIVLSSACSHLSLAPTTTTTLTDIASIAAPTRYVLSIGLRRLRPGRQDHSLHWLHSKRANLRADAAGSLLQWRLHLPP
ncbi:hypothetical protein VTI74DRAFT_4785 [Chaetomium olivicolor]